MLAGFTDGWNPTQMHNLMAAGCTAFAVVLLARVRSWQTVIEGAWGTLLSLTLAALVAAVALTAIVRAGDESPGFTPAEMGTQDGGVAGSYGRQPVPAALPAPASAPAPAPATAVPAALSRWFAGAAEAARELDFPVRQATALPVDGELLAAVWRPERTGTAAAGQPPRGLLRMWYSTGTAGVVFLLAQGPGQGVTTAGAPADRTGTATLADGTRVVWVRGHLHRGEPAAYESADDPRLCACWWEGDELRVGVPASDHAGWWLEGRTLALDELVRLAEGVR